ncbi:MAG: VOC family protein [Synechococcales bacterium]|nr:VOC family protein [Synechococcales bacterium]
MDFHYIYTRLNVENFPACKAFYRDVLGLPVQFEDDMDEYVEFKTGGTRLSLFNREKLTDYVSRSEPLSYDAHSARVVISFEVSNMDEAIAHLEKHGVELVSQPTNFPDQGFVSACFRDPDGNLVELEQMTDVVIS